MADKKNIYELTKEFNEDLMMLAKKYDLQVVRVGGMRMSDDELANLRKKKALIIDHVNLIGEKES